MVSEVYESITSCTLRLSSRSFAEIVEVVTSSIARVLYLRFWLHAVTAQQRCVRISVFLVPRMLYSQYYFPRVEFNFALAEFDAPIGSLNPSFITVVYHLAKYHVEIGALPQPPTILPVTSNPRRFCSQTLTYH